MLFMQTQETKIAYQFFGVEIKIHQSLKLDCRRTFEVPYGATIQSFGTNEDERS